jgi:hypothetical protein
MPSNYDEPEELLNDFINAEEVELNVLDEAVNEKGYSRPNISVDAETLNQSIPEPSFAPPPVDFSKPPSEDFKKEKREPINPEMEDLPKGDKAMASEVLAGMILDGYGMLHMLANRGLMVSEKKLIKMQQEGEINLNVEIPYEYNKKIRAGEFFQEYNNQAENLLSVSDEFKEEVTPVLKKVLQKRGLGLTPEQQLMYMFGKDIAGKAVMFVSMKSQLNQMIEVIKDATTGGMPIPQTAPQPTPTPPPPAEEPVYAPEYEEPIDIITSDRGTGSMPTTIIIKDVPPKKSRGRQKKNS